MKNILLAVLLLILLVACNSPDRPLPLSKSGPSLYEKVRLNVNKGYILNTLSKDTIKPIVNSLGDTIITGKAIVIVPKMINAELKENRSYLPLGAPEAITLRKKNQLITPLNNTEVILDRSIINEIALGHGKKGIPAVNKAGDTIVTGKKIKLQAKVTTATNQPKTSVSNPEFKGNTQSNIRNLDVDHGLTSSYIYSIIEDDLGRLWFGTYGNGIMIYDGNSIQSFTAKEGLISSHIRKLFNDSKGNIWIGSEAQGLIMFDGKKFYNYSQADGFLGKNVYDILEDKNGNIWCATEQGVSKFDGKYFTHLSTKEGISDRTIWSLCEDSKGRIWMGNDNGVVSCFNGSTFVEYGKEQGISEGNILDITEDRQGNIWISSMGSGVYRLSGNTITHFGTDQGMSGKIITSITEDEQQNIWFTSYGQGVFKYNGSNFEQFTEEDGLSRSSYWMMHSDPSGALWFGSEGGGISIIREASFLHLTSTNGLKSNIIWALENGEKDEIWLSNLGYGLARMKNSTLEYWNSDQNLSSNNILAILHDSKKNIWLGSWGNGVDLLLDNQVTNFNSDNGLGSDHIFSILEDSQGSIWFSTASGGAVRFDGTTFYHFSEEQGLGAKNVRTIFEDSKGNFWFGTDGAGAVKYDGNKLTHYTQKEGLCGNAIRCIQEDKRGNIWIGTYQNGLSIFTGEEFIQIGVDQGLTNNNIRTIDKTKDDLFIVGTEKGLNLLKTTFNKKEIRVDLSTRNKQDGLKGIDFYLNTSLIDGTNKIWWATGKALTSSKLDDLFIPKSTPKVTISNVDINEQFYDFTQENTPISYDGTPEFQNTPLNSILQYNQNHLTFHFSGVDWKAPHSIQYCYRLNNEKWSRPSSEQKADYRNLSSGHYTFEVRAMGSNFKWGKSEHIEFEILPPWWKTWWAYVLYILVIAGCIFLIYRYQLKRQLTINEAQRLREMNRVKTEFFTNISHEFRTPLTIITGLRERLANNYKERKDTAFNKNVDVLHRNSDQLLSLVNQLLDISKLEHGAIDLRIETLNLDLLVRKELSSYASSADIKQLSLHVDCADPSLTLLADKKLFKSIFHNIVGNALKFTKKGSITVRVIEKSSTTVSIAFIDTGIGIPSGEIVKVFDRFYQVDRGSTREFEGTGIGLAHVKQLVDLHSASIEVTSELGKGTSFELIFPRGTDSIISKTTSDGDESYEIDSKPKLLIVEDNADMRYFISLILEDEYTIFTANDGLEGLKIAQELVPDFIISDWMMPQMTGPELLQELRHTIITSHIPMMLLTARADQDSKIEGYKHGADAYLVKPFESEELKLRIKVLIDARNRLQAYYSDVKNQIT